MWLRFLLSLGVWTVVCAMSAVPSWHLSAEYSAEGKLLGIAFWVVIYSILTSSEQFEDRWEVPFERRAILITYALRAAIGPLSLLIPPLMTVDFVFGMISVSLVTRAIDFGNTVQTTALTTIIQGGLLSVATFLALLVIRLICKRVYRDPPRQAGFEVLPARAPE